MENSETIAGTSLENPDGLHKDEGVLHQVKEANKEDGKEDSGISSEDQTSKEQYSRTVKELDSQHFVVRSDKLKDPNICLDAPFYCELCAVKLANLNACQSHVKTKGHKKVKKTKGEFFSLLRVAPPSEHQILALNTLLDSVFLKHGLCPVKDFPTRQEIAKDVGKTVCDKFPECSVSIYGSSFTGFGLQESDVNLDLVIPDEVDVPHVLLSILDLLRKDEHYCDVKSEFDAKVPRILFKHLSSGLVCELSPGNGTAFKTSCLLKKYCDFDPRVRTLAVALRYWARICNVDCQSEGGLPGYSLALMVIQFLQETEPPVLPRLVPYEAIDKDSSHASENFVSGNKEEIGSLWFQLFRFYCVEFDIQNLVISIKDSIPVTRESKRWGHRRVAVEDPFSSKRNVACSLSSDRAYDYFFTCWKNSFLYFSSLPQNGPVPDVQNVNTNVSHKKSDKKQETKLVNDEEAIFHMDDLDHVTKQMQSLDLSSNDCKDGSVPQRQTAKESPSLKSKDQIDAGDEVEISLSGSNSEDGNDSRAIEAASASVNSREKGRSSKAVNSGTDSAAVQNIVYRFDAQVFKGNSKPIKTCCFCKEDGHIKKQCPDLRKPPLRGLPQMTSQFGQLLDYACKTCRADFEFEKSEVSYREKVLQNLEEYIHKIFPDARLFLFGSSKNGFGFRNSDIDICMTLEGHVREEIDFVDVISSLAKLLKKHKDCANVLAITTAKVPIVKFYLRSCKREADISLYNTLALENTKMLSTYAKLDDRVVTLGYTVKVFAKVCDIGDASKGSLSSYAYILLLLHYLQQCNPAVIPVLQTLHTDNKPPEKIIDGWNCWFLGDLKKIKSVWNQKEKNIHNAGLLWYGFLRYYTEEFDFEHDVVCCRRTRKLTKFEKMWTKHVFAIEDPFNLDHNLGAGVTRKMANYILSTFIKARERFGVPRYDIPMEIAQRYFFDVYFLTDGYEAPTDRNCRVCGKIGHIAKDCPHNKSNRRAEQKKEDDERRFGKEPGEKFDMSQKPFNAGPSRPRSTSAPNRQGQDRNVDNSKPLVTAQPKKIPSDQEANVPSVTHLSRSQPDSQVVAVSPLKGRQSSKPEDDIAENVHESLQAEIPHTQSPVQNLQTGLNNENLVSDSHETVLDTRNAHSQSMVQAVSSPVIKMESGKINTIAPCGNFVNEQSGIRPPVLLQSSVNNGCIGDRSITAVAPTTQTSSSVSIPLAQTQLSNLPSHVKPPPGFYAPDGAGQISRVSSERLPQPMAGSVPQSPPVNMPPGGIFGGQPIVLSTPSQHQPGMFSPQSGHERSPQPMAGSVSQSPLVNMPPGGIFEGQPIVFGTPPRHQPGMFSPQSGQFAVSPRQHEMWLRQHGGVMPSPHSPPMRPLVPYPLSPEIHQVQHWRGPSESMAVDHFGSPVRGHQRLTEHNHQMLPHSPPNISRSVMWPLAPNSPHQHLGNYQDPAIVGAQQFSSLSGHHLPFPQGNPHSVPPQQTQFPRGTPPGPAVGSPQRMPQVPQPGTGQPAIGTHMTGEQFINLMRAVEEESKKVDVLPTKLSSNKEFESKELHIAAKNLKVAKTPEEHKLLSKLSKVKSLWEQGNTASGLQSSCTNPETINELDPLQPSSDMVPSLFDTKLPAKREAWLSVAEKESGQVDAEIVRMDQDEREDNPGEAHNNTASLTEDVSEVSSEILSREERPSSSGLVASDEKQAQANKSSQENVQASKQQQSSAAASVPPGEVPREVPRQKSTRRGGRGRKPKGPRQNESPEKREKGMADSPNKAKNSPVQSQRHKNYDDFKGDALMASPSPKKPRGDWRSDGRQGEPQSPCRGAESTPHQLPRNKESPVSEKDSKKGGPGVKKTGEPEVKKTREPEVKKQDHAKNRQTGTPTRKGNPTNTPGDSSKGGAPSRGRRRPRSRAKSGGAGDEKQDSRNRSNSTPEKH